MARIELQSLAKSYGAETVVDGVDLTVAEGELIVLLGPSGCGKTTTLRMIAGLEEISSGELRFDGRRMNEEPPEKRGVGMVFQNYALYPHMTVAANLSFGLESRRARGSRRKARTDEGARVRAMAELLEIDHLLDHRPKELSGGQRQRVALGRALIREPDVFLLDEPLSNLDASLRDRMRMELARLHEQLPITTIYVTHDQGEALTLADRIVVMHEGHVRQDGPPGEVYERPADTFVAGFLGSPGMNLWPLPRDAEDGAEATASGIRLPSQLLDDERLGSGPPVTVGIRPEHLELVGEARESLAVVACAVQLVENLGSHLLVHATTRSKDETRVVAHLDPASAVRRGDHILLGAPHAHLHLFDARSGARVEAGASRGLSSVMA